MAQKTLLAPRMPELQLRQELKTRFPEINGATLIKVMKMHNNDTEKCIRTLEQESQKCLFGGPADFNSHPDPPNHNNNHHNNHNSVNHSPFNNINRSNSHQPPPSAAGVLGVSHASPGMSRYQELPVKHETTHISTVKHTVAPSPKPPPPPPSSSSPFPVHAVAPAQPSHPLLFIDPANRDDPHPHPHTAPVRPLDFSPFIESSPRRQTDIPNIRCAPTSVGGGGGGGGSPESRRPVRVINVQGFGSGGTVTAGPILSPTSAMSNPRFRVVLGDGGGLCSMPATSAPVTSSKVNPYQFPGQAFVPSSSQARGQETERSGLHSSSIYIDSATNPRTANIQESGETGVTSHPHHYGPSAQVLDSQAPSSLPALRAAQPLTVSLSSLATPHPGPATDRGQSVVSFAEFAYAGGYNAAPQVNSAGFVGVEGGGGRFTQEGASPSPPRSSLPMALALQGLGQLSVSSGGVVGPPPPASSAGVMGLGLGGPYGVMSPSMLPKSPRLQHQRSTGSSTSRSNSMDSEQGSVHHPSDPPSDPFYPPRPSPPTHFHHHPSDPPSEPFYPPRPSPPTHFHHHPSDPPSEPFYPPRPSPPTHLHHHHHRGLVGMGVSAIGMPVLSPASSQSSLSSESSAHNRDPHSIARRRSGSLQEEAAYTQALLLHQKQRMDKLTEDIGDKRQMLSRLRHEVSDAEKSKLVKSSIRTTFPTADDIAQLCQSNRRLQTDIQMYLNEIDMYRNGQTPFRSIDPMGQQNFFNNMPTGPNDLFTRPQLPRQRTPPPPPPPPRPPPPPPPLRSQPPQPPKRVNSNDLSTPVPPPVPAHTQGGGGSGDSEEGERWACTACTFLNHPALKKCEMCEMPRLAPGT